MGFCKFWIDARVITNKNTKEDSNKDLENGNDDNKFGLRPGLRVDVFNYHDRSRIRLIILYCKEERI